MNLGGSESLSKTTKLILLDSLLQEVCIKFGLAGLSPLSSLRLRVCLCQSQTSLFRTKDSPLNTNDTYQVTPWQNTEDEVALYISDSE